MLKQFAFLSLLLIAISAQLTDVCENGSICSDNDYCTGTISSPDICEGGICFPGEAFCPTYVKQTVIGRNQPTGELQVTNDNKWVYLLWNSDGDFLASKAHLYVSSDPLVSDDPQSYPFQLVESISNEQTIQMRVSLELLHFPTEMDPIYISLRLENNSGAGSWMSGYFTPAHHTHGGSYSYTSVCHCQGYSHVQNLVDWDAEIFSFSSYVAQTLPEEGYVTDSASTLLLSYLLLGIVAVLAL